MTASRLVTRLGGLVCVAIMAVDPIAAQGPTSGAEALRKAGVLERLAGSAAAPNGGPGFVLDPAWPKPLPNNWIIGDIGGLVRRRPRSHLGLPSAARALDRPTPARRARRARTRRGARSARWAIPRPYGQLSGCCVPAPSVLEFDKAGNLLQAWGGPADPGFLDKKCRAQDGCIWPAREHGIFVDHNDFVYISGNGQAANFHGQYPWAPELRQRLAHPEVPDATARSSTRSARPARKGPNSNDTNGGINGTPQPFWSADMSVDPKTNRLYVADGYGNRRVLIVDAATGKYVGHFGAYGQNPVVGENGGDDGEGVGPWAGDFRKGALKPKFFRSPLHCAKLATTACSTSAIAATTASRSSRRPKWASPAPTRTARSASAASSARSRWRRKRPAARRAR